MAVEAGELCGFGTGSFEKKVISHLVLAYPIFNRLLGWSL